MNKTSLVGILNVTPDSFSDGGHFERPEAALGRIVLLREEGADIVDIGAESTRPGATPVAADEEWERLRPVVSALPPGDYSIDTRHGDVAQKMLKIPHKGMLWINDVSGFADPAMVAAVKDSDCRLVVMHSLSVPADKAVVLDESADVLQVLLDFAGARIEALTAAGIAKERIIFDPGLGFGKTAAQSWRIIEEISRLKTLSVPLLVGHSRKSFLGEDKDAETLAVSKTLIEQGVDYIRVHDVAAHKSLLGICNEH